MQSGEHNDVGRRTKKKIKRLYVAGIILGSIAALLILAYLSAPRVARWYIMRNYPEVEFIAFIDIHLNGSVDMWDVVILKPGLTLEFEHVYADYKKNITLERGWVTLDLDKFKRPKPTKGGDGPAPNITAKDINVRVKKGNQEVTFNKVDFDGQQACFQHGKAVVKKGTTITATIGTLFDSPNAGCFNRENKTLSLAKVTFTIILPWAIPRVEKSQQVVLHSVEIKLDDWSLFARNLMFITNEQEPNLNIVNLEVKKYDEAFVASATNIVARHPWLTNDTERGYQIDHVNLFVPRESDKPIQLDAGHLGIGGVKVTANQATKALSAEGKCADWLETLPPIRWWSQETYEQTRGDLIFSVQAKPPKINLKVDCSIKCDSKVITSLKKKFTYTAYDKDRKPFQRTGGPRSGSWTPLRILPEHVHKAFIMLEDPGFEWHKGVHRVALLNSLKINLKAGRFVRGGSTITMQLVKNIWLSREKTIDRKLKEIILATMIEGCLSKYEILELYLNVIEFGPKLYGIGPASRHYFSIVPANLSADEAVYLARLLPRPNRAIRPEDGGMDRIHKLMGKLKERGKLPEALEGFDAQFELPEIPAPPTGKQPAVRSE